MTDLTDEEQTESAIQAEQIKIDYALADRAYNVAERLAQRFNLDSDEEKLGLLGHAIDLVINSK